MNIITYNNNNLKNIISRSLRVMIYKRTIFEEKTLYEWSYSINDGHNFPIIKKNELACCAFLFANRHTVKEKLQFLEIMYNCTKDTEKEMIKTIIFCLNYLKIPQEIWPIKNNVKKINDRKIYEYLKAVTFNMPIKSIPIEKRAQIFCGFEVFRLSLLLYNDLLLTDSTIFFELAYESFIRTLKYSTISILTNLPLNLYLNTSLLRITTVFQEFEKQNNVIKNNDIKNNDINRDKDLNYLIFISITLKTYYIACSQKIQHLNQESLYNTLKVLAKIIVFTEQLQVFKNEIREYGQKYDVLDNIAESLLSEKLTIFSNDKDVLHHSRIITINPMMMFSYTIPHIDLINLDKSSNFKSYDLNYRTINSEMLQSTIEIQLLNPFEEDYKMLQEKLCYRKNKNEIINTVLEHLLTSLPPEMFTDTLENIYQKGSAYNEFFKLFNNNFYNLPRFLRYTAILYGVGAQTLGFAHAQNVSVDDIYMHELFEWYLRNVLKDDFLYDKIFESCSNRFFDF